LYCCKKLPSTLQWHQKKKKGLKTAVGPISSKGYRAGITLLSKKNLSTVGHYLAGVPLHSCVVIYTQKSKSSLVHTNSQKTDPFFASVRFFGPMLWKKIGRKDRKIPICSSDFFNVIKNRTDVKKLDGY
jgi:hypothetical protein